MGNKGFAITGILYTLFVLFLVILFSILGTMNFKSTVLEKTVLRLQDDLALTKVDDIFKGVDEKTGKANFDGKYIFERKLLSDDGLVSICSVYLNKGDIITKEELIFIPNDCNLGEYVLDLDGGVVTDTNMVLKEVYKY